MAASWPTKRVEKSPYRIALRTDQIAQSETLLCVYPKCDHYSSEDYAVRDDLDNTTQFKVTGRSYSDRRCREFRDASGLPLFELHRGGINVFKGRPWNIRLPGSDRTRILEVSVKYLTGDLEIRLQNAAAVDGKTEGEKTVTLDVLKISNGMLIYKVMLGDKKLVDIRESIEKNKYLNFFIDGSKDRGMPRPVWDVRIAEGFDLSLATLIAVIISDRHSSQLVKAERA